VRCRLSNDSSGGGTGDNAEIFEDSGGVERRRTGEPENNRQIITNFTINEPHLLNRWLSFVSDKDIREFGKNSRDGSAMNERIGPVEIA
jgi:hypothetical protein